MADLSEEQLTLDLEELRGLEGRAERPGVKACLAQEISRLQVQLTALSKRQEAAAARVEAREVKAAVGQAYVKKVNNYAWDQSDRFVTFYVDLPAVEKLPRDQIECGFEEGSFSLTVRNLKGVTYQLALELFESVDPSKSSYKVKEGKVVVMVRKRTQLSWTHATRWEKKSSGRKTKDKPADSKMAAASDDPQAGIMNLMRQMYEDGDDNMKQTINKAMYESQQKKNELP